MVLKGYWVRKGYSKTLRKSEVQSGIAELVERCLIN
jgi:hypothetical protein